MTEVAYGIFCLCCEQITDESMNVRTSSLSSVIVKNVEFEAAI